MDNLLDLNGQNVKASLCSIIIQMEFRPSHLEFHSLPVYFECGQFVPKIK